MTIWAARVEWYEAGDTTANGLATIAETLEPHRAAVGRELEPDRASACLVVESKALPQAVDLAMRLVRDAVQEAGRRFDPLGVEVLDEETFVARVTKPSIPPLVGYAEIAEIAGVSRQRARELATLQGFPPTVVATLSGPLWVRSQVEAWLAKVERQPGRPRKASDPSGLGCRSRPDGSQQSHRA
ncbi:hypothetical protein [Actinopolymorpha pittospori]|uniref:Helix-turn-helix domain-containing protein n=1 Tax=Actinopolymorpha pittospori TaxID=648752 RepID=A0A927N490_9ACTN|nr:hypothetical protein [Actinopolymorpha pittospori]MBE1608667.1 hypothetical protein [Actinopolymorpha pittospori]